MITSPVEGACILRVPEVVSTFNNYWCVTLAAASVELYVSRTSAGVRLSLIPLVVPSPAVIDASDVTTSDGSESSAAAVTTFSVEAAAIARQMLTADIVSSSGNYKPRVR